MYRFVQVVALAGAVSAIGCGATQRAPVTTAPTSSGPTVVNTTQRGVIPAGQELDVRLQTALSSETAMPEQRFEAVTAADVMQEGAVLIPAGSRVRGVVTDVKRPGRIDRVGSLTLSFDQIEVRGRSYPIRAMATQVFESGGIREEAGTAGVGAGAGAVLGGLLGGLKGAVLGAVIGAGGAIAATEGKDITLPAGTIARIRLDQPLRV
ncbi:MAG TPA: hypothetical protein VFO21_23690 [Vicinamibacterales bacterium]|jgi:hypothetical protein|nr:hypothetical protein [Vicinamibacterales bacterium]